MPRFIQRTKKWWGRVIGFKSISKSNTVYCRLVYHFFFFFSLVEKKRKEIKYFMSRGGVALFMEIVLHYDDICTFPGRNSSTLASGHPGGIRLMVALTDVFYGGPGVQIAMTNRDS